MLSVFPAKRGFLFGAVLRIRRVSEPALPLSPETLGSFGTSIGNFDGCPEFLRFDRPVFRRAPSLQIQFDGFAQISASTFDIVALRRNTQFRTAGDVKVFFFGDQDRESVSHMAMLALPA